MFYAYYIPTNHVPVYDLEKRRRFLLKFSEARLPNKVTFSKSLFLFRVYKYFNKLF
jgi:hypothetical protein